MAYISDKDLNVMAEKAAQAQKLIAQMKELTDFAQAIEDKRQHEDATLVIGVGASGKNDGILNDADSEQHFAGQLYINLAEPIKVAIEEYQAKLKEDLLKLKNSTIEEDTEDPDAQKITVTFDANGGTGTAPDPIVGDKDSQIELPENTFTAPTGKTFVKWSSNAQDNGSHSGVAGDKMTLDTTADFVMYAIWG